MRRFKKWHYLFFCAVCMICCVGAIISVVIQDIEGLVAWTAIYICSKLELIGGRDG